MEVPSEIGFELVRQLYRQGFDPAFTSVAKIDYAMGIPLTHLGVEDPVLPIYVNAYLPPQPTMERCYAFGQAVARIITGMDDFEPRPDFFPVFSRVAGKISSPRAAPRCMPAPPGCSEKPPRHSPRSPRARR